MTNLINIRSAPDGWQNNPAYVYIGRANASYGVPASKWANPYSVDAAGSRDAAIRGYRQYIEGRPSLLADLSELRGKTLVCWCAPQACHGDVLIGLLSDSVPDVFGVSATANGKPRCPATRYTWRPASADEQVRGIVAYRAVQTHLWHADGFWFPHTQETAYTEAMLQRRYGHYLAGFTHGDDVPGWWLVWERTQDWIEQFMYDTREAAA